MSNYLAIATVTAALQRLLQSGIREDVPGAIVTTVRPDHPTAMNQTIGINIYLYQATPNPAWRNADLRTRRPKGDLIKHGLAGLDLHYLLTFYGNEQELEPQRLLGSAIRTLVDQPTLTQDIIRDTLDSPGLPFLAESTLEEQTQAVQFMPSNITTDDLSRIWSVFFQIPYSLSFAFQGTAVLIEGEKPGRVALPVRRRQFYVASARPVIDRISIEKANGASSRENGESTQWETELLTRSSNLIIVIKGRGLKGERVDRVDSLGRTIVRTVVQIGRAEITPQVVSDNEIRVQLSALPAEQSDRLRAGVQGVQIVHRFQRESANLERLSEEPDRDVESNVISLVLCPGMVGTGAGAVGNGTVSSAGVALSEVAEQDENVYRGTITTQVDVTVAPEQRVFLLLNGTNQPKTYIFRAIRRTSETRAVIFPIQGVLAGTYLVRIQVDGAESPLIVNADDEYSGPIVTIP